MSSLSKSLRRWGFVHKWSSLICTVFMLMLCVTGLPLIFHHEIDHLLHDEVQVAPVEKGTPFAPLDAVVAAALAHEPGHVPHYLIWDFDEPQNMLVSIGKTMDDNPASLRLARVDAYRAAYLETPDISGRFTNIMLRLHTDMFGGLPGKLFLGLMGFLFCVAIISGIVVYAPSMRKLSFGAYRRERPRVVRWLDLHNLTGILLMVWMLVVGFTGVINTWADLVIKVWQFNELSVIIAPYKDRPLPAQPTSIDAALRVAHEAAPDMRPGFIAFPGSAFSSRAHYLIFMRGNTPLTSRLGRPVLIDATTGAFAGSPEPPWYVKTLLISQPLHFGDYGGLPLRIIWAILDIITIVVLITGLYLWLRRRSPAASAARASAAVPS
ncbi:PepSY domain-containing protein [Tardiphaga alba]|uniref:PepSY domain-containing protein n=1 Tax=Tardiphaga alba TaxID=340268 RepID=A0ABX8AG73_9BRAD|nr:PepSY-associated TM helix domain-containing protein [Tardiphaga alba]QUS41921.1 PepSY domain-containing protein [Tardiphaga alba]